MQRLWEFGDQWVTDRPGTSQLYRAWYDPTTRRVRYATLGTGDLEEAKRALAAHVLKHEEIGEQREDEVELAMILERYWERHGSALASRASTRAGIDVWNDHFGPGALVSEVEVSEIRAMTAALLARGLAAGTVRRYLGVGQAALNRAVREGELRHAPIVPLITDGAEFEHVATVDEMAAFIGAIHADHLLTYVAIRLATACRGDAALDLAPAQVDFEHSVVALNPKGRPQTRKRRPTLRMVDHLAVRLAATPAHPTYVHWRGERLTTIKEGWAAARKAADLPPHFIPKILRHTMATELRAAGVPEWEAQGWLGHRATRTTDRYAKFRPDYMAAAAGATAGYIERVLQKLGRSAL